MCETDFNDCPKNSQFLKRIMNEDKGKKIAVL